MPGRLQQITVGLYGSFQCGVAGVNYSDDTTMWGFDYCYERRAPQTIDDPEDFFSLWPSSRLGGDGVALELTQIGQDYSSYGRYEPVSCAFDGNNSRKFLIGQCLDNTETPVPSAVVHGYRTSTDEETFQATADAVNGTFSVPTHFTDAHYLVAYKAGSPDIAGTSVNTLTPTNSDGT